MKNLLPLIGLLLTVGVAPTASAQDQPWRGASVTEDPEWRKHFLGSYGFLSGAEPEIASDERETLREVIALMESNPQAAADRLKQQVGADSSAALDFVLANLYFQNGETDVAAGYYESALDKFPDFRRAHKNLGLLLVQKNDCDAALPHFSRAVELGDRDGRNYGLMGYCYINLENYLAAEIAYRNAILQQPDTKDWKLGLARALLALEHYPDAIALLGDLIQADPEDATSWMLQANAYIGAEKPMAAAINLETVRMMGRAQRSSLVLLGDIYMNARMPELAKSAYLDAIQGDDAAPFATAYRAADLLVRARAQGEAQEILALIDRRYGQGLPREDQLKVLTLKAKVARAQGRDGEAARLLESIVRQDGARGDALLELAAYYDKQGEREKALLLIERAERLEAFAYAALLQHAQLLVAERDYAKAAEVLRKALQIKQEPRVERYLSAVEQAIRPET